MKNSHTKEIVLRDSYRTEVPKKLELAREDGLKISFALVSLSKADDYAVADLAASVSAVESITLSGGTEIAVKGLTKIEKALLRLSHAQSLRTKKYATDRLSDLLTKNYKKSLSDNDLAWIYEEIPKDLAAQIKHDVKERLSQIAGYHSTPRLDLLVSNYRAINKIIDNNIGKLIVLKGGMGGGKTEYMRDEYAKDRDAGLFPAMLTAKRSIASNFFSEDHADHYQTNSSEGRKGIIGVVNTFVSPRFEEDRAKIKVLYIDEVQDLLDHLATGTIGQCFKDRIAAFERVREVIRSAKKVVVADAMITDETVSILEAVTGEKALVVSTDKATDMKINLVKESEVISKAREDAEAGKKVAIFCDYNAQKFSEVAESIKADSEIEVTKIDADYFQTNGLNASDIDSILTESQVALISPVINAGASITLEEYDRVYVLAGKTLSPTSLLQSVRRFRFAKEAYVAFRNGGEQMNRVIEPESIIFSGLRKSVAHPYAEAGKLYKTEAGRTLADHAAGRNGQFDGFRQVFIIAAEQMGFEVSRPEFDSSYTKKGNRAKRVGRQSNEAIRHRAVMTVSLLSSTGRTKEIDFGTSDSKTWKQECSSRALAAMDLLKLSGISETNYLEIFHHNIDSVVIARRLLSKAFSSDSQTLSRTEIAADRAVIFLRDCGVDFDGLAQSAITKERIDKSFESLTKMVKLESDGEMSGLELVKMTFPAVDFSKKYRVQIVKGCMQALGYDLSKAYKVNGVRTFSVIERVIQKDGEYANISKMADQYEVLRVDPEARAAKIMDHSAPVLKSEKDLAKRVSYDRKKRKEKKLAKVNRALAEARMAS